MVSFNENTRMIIFTPEEISDLLQHCPHLPEDVLELLLNASEGLINLDEDQAALLRTEAKNAIERFDNPPKTLISAAGKLT